MVDLSHCISDVGGITRSHEAIKAEEKQDQSAGKGYETDNEKHGVKPPGKCTKVCPGTASLAMRTVP